MLRRTNMCCNDYKSTAKVSEAFHNVINRTNLSYDHVAIDVGSITAQAGRMLKDLLGAERDAECIKFVNKTVFNTLLRRVQPKKSLALFFDGSDPLWKLRRSRVHPGKRFEGKFYRSAASPMVYALEERLRQSVVDTVKVTPMTDAKAKTLGEFLISGPATVGPVEAKLSQWMLDLAARRDVSKNDSICLLGGTDLFMSALGAVPFHNVTTLVLNAGEFKSMSVQETFEWLCMDHVFTGATAPAAGTESNADAAKRLGRIRTDVTLLLLLSNGISATDTNGIGINFKDLMDAYSDLVALDKTPSGFFLMSDDGPNHTIRLHCAALERLLSRATRKTGVARACNTSADALEILLQSHAMLCNGGIRNYRFVPRGEAMVLEKPPTIRMESFIGHLKFLASQQATGDGRGGTTAASVEPDFALTAAESLLLSAPNVTLIDQIFPLFSNGHPLPSTVAEGIVSTKDIDEALDQVRGIMGTMTEGGGGEAAPHRAVYHNPSHLFQRVVGAKGPPVGFEYASVNLGVKSSILQTRRRYLEDASEETVVDVGAGGARNTLAAFNPSTSAWEEVPCTAVAAPVSTSSSVGEAAAAGASPLPSDSRANPSTLRVMTWNVQFNRHSGEETPLGRAGIDWCTTTRYVALAKTIQDADADVVAMQEVEPAWWAYLSTLAWVQERYSMSCLQDSHTITPWGVLMLVHKRIAVLSSTMENVPGFTGHTSIMPSLSIQLAPNVPLTINAFHLLAPYSSNNVSNRVTQVQSLVKKLGFKYVGSHCIAMGDFNDFPTQFLKMPEELRFKDAWVQMHPEAEDPLQAHGYTIDGKSNPYCALIIEPQFYGRADRILSSSNRLQPIEAVLVGTKRVQDMVADGEIGLPQGAKCPAYLHPSDHLGVLVEFQVL